jgi:hypothetical protein
MGEKMNAYLLLVGKPERKTLLGNPRRRWVDNIKMDLSEMGCDGLDWIGVAQDRDNQSRSSRVAAQLETYGVCSAPYN